MEQFPVLILTGRPASGKSEIIDYLLHLDPAERLHRFRILIVLMVLFFAAQSLYTTSALAPQRCPSLRTRT